MGRVGEVLLTPERLSRAAAHRGAPLPGAGQGAGLRLSVVPHEPQDDWTRAVPRSPRRGRGAPRPGDEGWDDWDDPSRTRAIPERGRGRDDDSWAEAYREDDDYVPRGRSARQGGGAPPPPRPPRPPRSTRPPRRRRPRYGFRRLMALLALLVVAYVVTMAVVVAQVWGSVGRTDSTPDVSDRPAASAGSSFLLVGTDSREQLTAEQQAEFGTGYTGGHRADTVMLLHVPTTGEPTLVSLPRDSFVTIRDNGENKLNAAHSIGGAPLLVDTVEQATGMRIDGYLEIGFGGFVGVVEEVGGVHMCLDAPVQDDKAHVDLPAGCQDLTGPEALGYVRMRYSDPMGDLGRVERQRQFLAALVDEMMSPATVLNPLRLHSVGTATGEALTLGEDTSMLETARMALAMRALANGKGHSVTVPTSENNYPTAVGSAVLWDDAKATALFDALREGDPITVEP